MSVSSILDNHDYIQAHYNDYRNIIVLIFV